MEDWMNSHLKQSVFQFKKPDAVPTIQSSVRQAFNPLSFPDFPLRIFRLPQASDFHFLGLEQRNEMTITHRLDV